jgi:flagellar biosynthesis protein FlhB
LASEDQSKEDRTEAATQRHLQHAREQGQVPISREVTTFAALAAATLVLGYQSPAMVQGLLLELSVFISRADDASLLGSTHLHAVSAGVAGMILPILGATIFAAAAAVLLQTNFLLNLGGMKPKFSRVSPAAGLKRIFGFNGLVEVVKSIAKLGLFSTMIWFSTKGDLLGLLRLPRQDPHGVLAAVARPVFHIFMASLLSQGVIAVADLMWVRFRHTRDMRMSRQDIRDEFKDTEGNPHVKAQMRRIRVARARKRMMANVPTATVVITNPTHYAVALTYDRVKNPAPRIVAKGVDAMAARIREVATANRVPLVANPMLARALYRFEIDTEIPAEHYKAVAEVIAYVWRLRQTQRAVL